MSATRWPIEKDKVAKRMLTVSMDYIRKLKEKVLRKEKLNFSIKIIVHKTLLRASRLSRPLLGLNANQLYK